MKIFLYLFRQTFVSYIAVASLLLIIIISGRFVSYLADAATGRFAGDLVLSLILFKLPSFASLILPIGLFIGILLSYGQLYVDSEMVVIKACGISKVRLLAYVMGPAVLVMLMVGSLTLWLAPLGNQLFMKAWNDPDNFSGVGVLLPGNFQAIGRDSIIYIRGINTDKTEMEEVFFVNTNKGDLTSITRAQAGTINAKSYKYKQLVLERGEVLSFNPGKETLRLGSFAQMKYEIPRPKSSTIEVDIVDDVEALSTINLISTGGRVHISELLWRLSLMLLVPFSSLIALSMSETSHRKGRYAKLLPAILLFIAYLGLMILCKNESDKGTLPPAIILLPHLIFLGLGLFMYYFFEVQAFIKKSFLSSQGKSA